MVRPTKYGKKKTESLCISLDPEILERVKRQAKEHDKCVSEFVSDILTLMTQNEAEYAKMMAKKYARELYYWNGEFQRLEQK